MSERPTNNPPHNPSDNVDRELLAAAAAGDLTDAERAVVDAMCAGDPQARAELEALELAAGAIAAASTPSEDMPADLQSRILQGHRLQIQPAQRRRDGAATSPMAWMGWLAAAACLALAAVAWFASPAAAPPERALTLAEQRQQLLAQAPDAMQLDWQDWVADGAPPEISGVQGDVVWSESRQEGYLRFVGLPRNDAAEQQYQLWIIDRRGLFDETGQSARISGAIFNGQEGEVIVPIDPAIPVKEAGAFAVTIEEPGGVWASDMTRRVVIAAAG